MTAEERKYDAQWKKTIKYVYNTAHFRLSVK